MSSTDVADAAVLAGGPLLEVTWHSFDLATLSRGQEVRVASHGNLTRIIGEPTDTAVQVYCWDDATQAPVPGWDDATLPGRSMLVALDTITGTPIWGGMVVRRRSNHTATVSVDLVTLEGYFDRRYVIDLAFTDVPHGEIVTGLIESLGTTTSVPFTIDVAADALDGADTRFYSSEVDQTHLSALTELLGVENGPEFTIDLEWADTDHTRLAAVVRVSRALGAVAAVPAAVFQMPGPVVEFEHIEDFTAEHGANDVLATSSGEGDSRPMSDRYTNVQAGWVRFERRYTAATSIDSLDALNQHAARTLSEMVDGLEELTLIAHLDTAPRAGIDFHLGDDVEVALTCARFPETYSADGAPQPGFSDVLRCVGWDIDPNARRLRPTLRRRT